MKREDEYRQLASDILQRASEEQSAILRAQWKILSASYIELAVNRSRSKKTTRNMTRSRGIGCGAIEYLRMN
jgi:hypothetical protein